MGYGAGAPGLGCGDSFLRLRDVHSVSIALLPTALLQYLAFKFCEKINWCLAWVLLGTGVWMVDVLRRQMALLVFGTRPINSRIDALTLLI